MARGSDRPQQRPRGAGTDRSTKASGTPVMARPQAQQTAGKEGPHGERSGVRPVARPTRRPSLVERRRRQRLVWLFAGISVIAIVAIIVVVVASSSNQNANCSITDGLSCGSAAPVFTLPQVPSMKEVSLSDYRGRPVLLELFATWCPHCQRMAPILEQLGTANKNKGLVILSVLADQRDHNAEGNAHPGTTSPQDVEWFVNQFHVKHPVFYDPQVANAVTAQSVIYKLTSFPTIYLLDKNGIIRASHAGEFTQADMQTLINQVV